MKKVIEDGEGNYYSIHPEPNAFWEIRYKLKLIRFISISKLINAFFFSNFNIYRAIVPDRMHTLDLGLFKYMLDYTKELLNDQCERQVMQIFEQRLTLIPRHKGLKILKKYI